MTEKQHDENWAKKHLKTLLDTAGVFHWPNAANGMGVSGLSDRTGVKDGVIICVEAKRPGRRGEANRGASALQEKFLRNVSNNGGIAMVFDAIGADLDWLREAVANPVAFRGANNLDSDYWKKTK